MENIQVIENTLLPKLNEFKANVEEFEKNNIKTQEVVQQLDYNLTLKLNKSSMVALENEWNAKYVDQDQKNDLIN